MILVGDRLRRRQSSVRTLLTFALSPVLLAAGVSAHAQPADTQPSESNAAAQTYQTLYLTNIAQENDASEMMIDLRNMLPHAKIFYIRSENAISMLGTPADFQIAHRMLADLDRNRPLYRLTYTMTDTDGGRVVGSKHVSLVVASGGHTTVKQGSRMPIVTGTTGTDKANEISQVQYVDLGLNIDAFLDGPADDLRLRTKVEQSNVAGDKSAIVPQDPVVGQTVLEGNSLLMQGKPLVLGTLEIPGTTRQEAIEVSCEQIR